MIHLDRNHHPLSMHSSPNLILPSTHTDQLKLLSRSPLTRDDNLVHQEHQQRSSNTTLQVHLSGPPASDAASVDETVKSHSSAPPSPPTEPQPLSPNGHRSSSLSPPPESVSPKPMLPTSPPADETTEEPAAEASRHSTPLSELSEESFEDERRDGSDLTSIAEASVINDAVADLEGQDEHGEKSEVKEEENKEADLSMASISAAQQLQSPRSPSATSTLISPKPLPESDGQLASTPEQTSIARAIPSKSPVKSPASEFALPQEPRAASRQPSVPHSTSSTTPAPSTDKAVRLLELNGELLKVCMEFQAHGIPMNESRFQEYATRLQANLTWLANVADASRQGNPSNSGLPIMEPPIAVDFISMERIHQLYADLPSMFSKEIARRQQIGVSSRTPSLMASFPSNLSLKRDRSDDIETSIVNKRRDTGESKSPPMRPPTVPPPPSMITPPSASFPMSTNGPAGHINMTHVQQMGMPSIAPPVLPQGMLPATEAQLAASARERARQAQIQQAVRQQQQQQQHQQQQSAGQMSPPSAQGSTQMSGQGQGQTSHAGPSTMPNSVNPNALAALGPNAMQNFQILQNPTHAFTQYMIHSVPGFTTLPLPQQLQRMQVVQMALQQKQQNQQASSQQRGPMAGMSQQPPMQPMQNNGMRGPQYTSQSGGVTSPTSSQSSTVQQQQSPQSGVFPFGQNQVNSGATTANAQMMGGMSGMNINLTPQQRQVMLQQQNMRAASSNANPAMMNPDQYAMVQERFRQEQQRMSQVGSPTNAGSPPMSAAGSDGHSFPTLRSNSTLPGIARSTRSPSDGALTPMSPQIPRGSLQDMRRIASSSMGGGMGGQMGGQIPGFNQQIPNWQQKNQQQQSMPMAHLQPPNYGVQPSAVAGNLYGSAAPSQSWPGQYSLASSPSYQQLEQTRQSSSTPAPQQMQSSASSPPAQQTSPELEIFNWNGQ